MRLLRSGVPIAWDWAVVPPGSASHLGWGAGPGRSPGRETLQPGTSFRRAADAWRMYPQAYAVRPTIAFVKPDVLRRPGGDEGTRTPDFCFAKAALSQLSYIPKSVPTPVGLSGFEPETFPLSEERSNQLS
jgi:hypothetical protein